MTAEKLNGLFKDVMNDMDRLKIPYSKSFSAKINTRAVRRRGACKKKDGRFIIELSVYCLDDPDAEIKNVIAHELIHTCPGCFNHGDNFKAYMDKLNAHGYSVATAYTGEAPELEQNAKYKIVCKSCGQTFYRMRMSDVVKYPDRYKCTCGGKLEVYVRK